MTSNVILAAEHLSDRASVPTNQICHVILVVVSGSRNSFKKRLNEITLKSPLVQRDPTDNIDLSQVFHGHRSVTLLTHCIGKSFPPQCQHFNVRLLNVVERPW